MDYKEAIEALRPHKEGISVSKIKAGRNAPEGKPKHTPFMDVRFIIPLKGSLNTIHRDPKVEEIKLALGQLGAEQVFLKKSTPHVNYDVNPPESYVNITVRGEGGPIGSIAEELIDNNINFPGSSNFYERIV